jgi:hypothetical protein
MKPGMTKGDVAAGVEAAREALTHGHNMRKIILVVSDDQRTNWNPGDEKEWTAALGHADTSGERAGAIPVFRVGLKPQGAAAAMANATVRGILMQPAFLGVHRPVQIIATVSNTGGTELTNVPIVLEVDGKRVAARPLSRLAAGESAAVRFDYYFPEAGNHWVRVKADIVDALDADNTATAAVIIKPKLPVLVVDGQLTGGGNAAGGRAEAFPQAAFLLTAMQPVDPSIDQVTLIDPTVISVSEFATLKGYRFEDFPIIILNDVPRLTGELVNRLAAHAQAGNGVWIILGPRTEESFINEVLARGPLVPIKTKGISHPPEPKAGEMAKFVTVDVKEPSNGALSLLTHGGQAEHGALAGVTLRSWWSVVPVVQEEKTVLATTTGDPLVLEMEMGRLGGKALVWTSSVNGDLGWNNFPLVAYDFLPLVNETLFNLASSQDAGQPRQLQAGQPLTWTGAVGGNQTIESADLICPDGSKRMLRPEMRGDRYYVEDRDTALPGLYELRFSASARAGATVPPVTYYSVNIDQDEMDPAVLSSEDLDWYKGHGFLTGSINLAGAGGGTTTAPNSEPAGGVRGGNITLAKALEATHGGMDIWWILGLLLLVLLVLEVLMTYVLVRQQAGKTLEEEGLDRVMPKGTVQEGRAGTP